MKLIYTLSILCLSQILVAQKAMYDVCPIKVGSEIPSGVVYDQNEQSHELTSLIGNKPSVLIFYRGAWCGYCTAHLAELNDIKAEVEELGYKIFGITVDRASKLEESQTKSESEIEVFSDAKADLIKSFGLDWQVDDDLFSKYINKYQLDLEEWSGESHHSLPVPAVFIIKDGIIQFQYVNPNYNTRLKAETLLALLSTI